MAWIQIPTPVDATHPGYDSLLFREVRDNEATVLALYLDDGDGARTAHVSADHGGEFWVTDYGAGPGAWRTVAPWDDDGEDEGLLCLS